jgi:protease II
VEAVQVAGDHLLVRDLDGGIGRLRRVPLAGGELEDVPMAVEGGILEWTGHPNRPKVLLLVASWTDAPRVYRYDGHAATLANTGLAPRSPVDYGDVDARTLQVPARDGALIPVTVIHRKGLALDGDNPTLLTGYGSYGHARPDAERHAGGVQRERPDQRPRVRQRHHREGPSRPADHRRLSPGPRRHAVPGGLADRRHERPAGTGVAAREAGRPPAGGHGIGSTRDQENALLADELAFLLHAFGLDEPQ